MASGVGCLSVDDAKGVKIDKPSSSEEPANDASAEPPSGGETGDAAAAADASTDDGTPCPTTEIAGTVVEGCCRENGTCGYALATCVSAEALGEEPSTQRCTFTPKVDDDHDDDDDDDDDDHDDDDDDDDGHDDDDDV